MPAMLRTTLWLGFFTSILAAWWIMYTMTQDMGLDFIGRSLPMMGEKSMGGMAMNGATMDSMGMNRFGTLFPMWAIMMAAMMLPTMVPTLRSYEDLIYSADGSRIGWLGVLLGYFMVWVNFAAGISLVQIILVRSDLIDMMGISKSYWLAGALLVLVGLFQFSRVKQVCHGVCHAPMQYFLGHWKTGFSGGVWMGIQLGVYCVGCCWGFMVLGFAGGVMNLLWMGLATLFMVIEKLPQIGHYVTKPMGVLLLVSGIAVIGYGII